MKYFLPAIFLALSLGSLFGLSKTQSFLSDEEKVSNNVLSVATTFVTGTPTPTVEPTPTVTPTPTPAPTNPGDVVINEVYYDVVSGKGSEETNEWIELYNNTSQPIDISGWKIEDNQGLSYQRIIPSSSPIPAYGYAVITLDASTWGYWSIPDGAIKIVLGNSIGNGLANDSDRLVLRDESEIIIDQMSYGTDTTVLDPSATDVAEGHSLERSPAGKDTDTAGDFVDRTVPTPGS